MRQRLAAYAVVADAVGRVLLTRHRPGRPGRWLLPGGGVEAGEHPEQAVVREVLEEAGLAVAVIGPPFAVLSDVSRVGRRRRRLHTVRLIYRARPAGSGAACEPARPGGQAGPERPGEAARWCSPREWRALPVAAFTASVLERLDGGGQPAG